MSSLNVAACLPAMAARHPDKIAIHQWEPGLLPGHGDYRALSYGRLDADSDDISRGLSTLGIGRGTRTVLMVPPGPDFFALAFGMAKAGVVPVLVDPGMDRASLKICIAEAAPEAFIGIPKAHGARVALSWGRGTIRTCITVGGVGLFGGHTLDDVRAAGRGSTRTALAATQPDELAAILFSSGSTGVAKGVCYTHANFAAQIEGLRGIARLGTDEVDLATFPPFALFDPALGMTTVVPDMDFARPASANPARIVGAIERFGATNMFCSPALLEVIERWAVPRGVKLPSLRRVVSAGAPVPARTIARFATLLSGDARIVTPYGATEALPVSAIDGREILGETQARTALGAGVCVGRPVDGMDVAVIAISDAPIAKLDDVQRLPAGEIGELIVRGDVVTCAYYGREEATSLAKIADGDRLWHRMGDVAYLDEQGRIWFCGRKSERVELSSERLLFTAPCEAIFDAHPEVRRCALVAIRSRSGVHPRAVMCIERAADSRTPERELVAQLLALAAAHPLTANIKIVRFHPHFPVDRRHNAKIRRDELARWAQPGAYDE